MINYIFDSPQRLRVIVVGLVTAAVIFAAAVLVVRIQSLQERNVLPVPIPATSSTAPEPTSTDLQPVEPGPQEASPTRDYGSAAPIAMEAVSAWLRGDLRRLGTLVEPEVLEGAAEAPAADGVRLAGIPEVLLDGPTRQKVSVPTTDGPLELDMTVIDGAWIVMDMKFAR